MNMRPPEMEEKTEGPKMRERKNSFSAQVRSPLGLGEGGGGSRCDKCLWGHVLSIFAATARWAVAKEQVQSGEWPSGFTGSLRHLGTGQQVGETRPLRKKKKVKSSRAGLSTAYTVHYRPALVPAPTGSCCFGEVS